MRALDKAASAGTCISMLLKKLFVNVFKDILRARAKKKNAENSFWHVRTFVCVGGIFVAEHCPL